MSCRDFEFVFFYDTGIDTVKVDAKVLSGGLWERPVRGGLLSVSVNEQGIISPAFKAIDDVVLHKIDAKFFPYTNMADGDLYYYNSGLATNDMCNIVRYDGEPSAEMKDLLLLKNKKDNRNFNLAMVTAWRFYTTVGIRDDYAYVSYDLEDKPVHAGSVLFLEKFIIGCECEYDFLDRYGEIVGEVNGAAPLPEIPQGWCSWSCYYADVNAEKIVRAADNISLLNAGNLVQIDDGWQNGPSFSGDWFADKEKFPEGMKKIADVVKDRGLQFGLWLSPLLISESSPYYNDLKHMVRQDVVCLGTDTHPFDLDNEAFYCHLKNVFRRMTNDYGAVYFKLDFLISSMRNYADGGKAIKYKSDYRTALFRKAMQTIRDVAGNDAVLLSCGAPVLECAGIFNAQRVSCDIIWGKNKDFPSYWQIMQNAAKTILYRSFYNGKVFLNDPDGVVMRDYDIGDGFDCTYSEARFWATAVAFSGGSVLVNEELEKISPARRQLFEQLMPPLKIAGKAVDMFEDNQPSAAIIKVDNNTSFLALYNYSDSMCNVDFDLCRVGMENSLVVKCWEKQIIGVSDKIHEENVNPHSVMMYMLKKISRKIIDKPQFLFSDVNLFLGINVFSDDYDAENALLNVVCKDEFKQFLACDTSVYAIYPDGFCIPDDAAVVSDYVYVSDDRLSQVGFRVVKLK